MLFSVRRTSVPHVAATESAAVLSTTGFAGGSECDGAKRSAGGNTLAQSAAGADGNGDGLVDPFDYAVWKNNFGDRADSAASAGAAVPEPIPSQQTSSALVQIDSANEASYVAVLDSDVSTGEYEFVSNARRINNIAAMFRGEASRSHLFARDEAFATSEGITGQDEWRHDGHPSATLDNLLLADLLSRIDEPDDPASDEQTRKLRRLREEWIAESDVVTDATVDAALEEVLDL